jgi:hypothetical protein
MRVIVCGGRGYRREMYNEGINHLYVCAIAVDSVFNARNTGLCGNRETSNIGYVWSCEEA